MLQLPGRKDRGCMKQLPDRKDRGCMKQLPDMENWGLMNKGKTKIHMKKIAAGLLTGAMCLTAAPLPAQADLGALASQFGIGESPYYHLGDTEWDHGGIEEYYFNNLDSSYNEIYRELYSRLSNREDSADLYAQVGSDEFWTAFRSVLADHPELFWIDSSVETTTNGLTNKVTGYTITASVPEEERDQMQAELEAAADACISEIDPDASEYEKIKAVYEYLVNTVDYDAQAQYSQCVQSALLNHKAVCAGYAKAFQYILHRMGFFCTTVSGATSEGGRHAWNLVRIGDQYYHVDVTWGDPVFAGAQDGGGVTVMNYMYLCCTDAEIYQTHVPDNIIQLPSCSDTSYDYYRMNGMYYETFDYDTVYNALMNSVYNGQNSVAMKFGSAEAYEQAISAVTTGKIYSDAAQYLMQINGVSTWSTSYSNDDVFHVITIQWS